MSYAMEDWSRLHRITVDEFQRMGELGLFDPEARVELIEGVIIDMAKIGPPHQSVTDKLSHLLIEAVGRRAIVRVQGPVTLNNDTQPMPDVALLKPRPGYNRVHPSGRETILAIEVSDSTLRYDRHVKLPLYARHGINELWVIDVNRPGIHFCRGRTDVGYSDVQFVENPGRREIPSLEGVSIDLTGLFEAEWLEER